MCCDVGVESALQLLDREPLQYAIANCEDGACLDVVARDFWRQNRQHAFFDVWVFNPFAHSYSCLPLSRCYHVHEQEKCRAHDEQIFERWREPIAPERLDCCLRVSDFSIRLSRSTRLGHEVGKGSMAPHLHCPWGIASVLLADAHCTINWINICE